MYSGNLRSISGRRLVVKHGGQKIKWDTRYHHSHPHLRTIDIVPGPLLEMAGRALAYLSISKPANRFSKATLCSSKSRFVL